MTHVHCCDEVDAAEAWERGYQACYERMQEEGRLLPAKGRGVPLDEPPHAAYQRGYRDGFAAGYLPQESEAVPPSEPPTCAALRGLAEVAADLVRAVDERHDTTAPPRRYTVPWDAVTRLRAALEASTQSERRP